MQRFSDSLSTDFQTLLRKTGIRMGFQYTGGKGNILYGKVPVPFLREVLAFC